MRKFVITVLIAAFSASSIAFADDGPQYWNSMDAGYNPGCFSIVGMKVSDKVSKLLEDFPFIDVILGLEPEKVRSVGTFSISYMRRLNKWLWVGGNFNFEKLSLDIKDTETEEISSIGVNAFPIMLMGKANWFRRPNVSLYSKVGFGVTPIAIEGGINQVKLAIQLSPVGVEFGGNHVFGFVEGGLGLQGELIGGLRFLF